MLRSITGFHLDDENHWVAKLECFHGQHQRHNPPLISRPWVVTDDGRNARLGTSLNCLRCDRREMPQGLLPDQAPIEINADTLLADALQDRLDPVMQWGLLRVTCGNLNLVDGLDDNQTLTITAGEELVLIPGLSVRLELEPATELLVDFFSRE